MKILIPLTIVSVSLTLWSCSFLGFSDHVSWKLQGEVGENIFRSFYIDHTGRLFLGTVYGGGYLSTDEGITWRTIKAPEKVIAFMCFFVTNRNHIFFGTNSGVFRSTDNGGTWARTYLPRMPDVLAIVSTRNGDLLAVNPYGLARSTDDGETWQPSPSDLNNKNTWSLVMGPDTCLYAATMYGGCYRSTDDGSTWIQINNGFTRKPTYPSDEVHQIVFGMDGWLFMSAERRVFASSNRGDTWTNISSDLPSSYIVSIAAGKDGTIIVATEFGTFQSSDIGKSWKKINTGLTETQISDMSLASNGHVFAVSKGGKVFRSTFSTKVNE